MDSIDWSSVFFSLRNITVPGILGWLMCNDTHTGSKVMCVTFYICTLKTILVSNPVITRYQCYWLDHGMYVVPYTRRYQVSKGRIYLKYISL